MLTVFAVIGVVAVLFVILAAIGGRAQEVGARRELVSKGIDALDAATASMTASELGGVRAGPLADSTSAEAQAVDRVLDEIDAATAGAKAEALALFRAGTATRDEARARILSAVLKACIEARWPGGRSFVQAFDEETRRRMVTMMTDAVFGDTVLDELVQRRLRGKV